MATGQDAFGRPVHLTGPDGTIRTLTLDADGHVRLWADVVLADQPGLVEVVRALRSGDGELRMRSRRDPAGYLDARDTDALVALAADARGRGEEVFATPLPRSAPEPGKRSAAPGQVAWVDLDGHIQGSELGRLGALRPHLTVHSGGGIHAYWRLSERLEPAAIESLNRRLCQLVGGDQACTDRGRIMRLPGSFNGRRERWCRVLRADRSRDPLDAEQVRRVIPDPDPPRPAPLPRSDGYQGGRDDELALIDPPTYFRALAGVDVPEGGEMIRCPLPDHEDQRRSCQVFAEPERGWWCYGCARGGRIYDLASLLAGGPWGRGLREDAFLRARELAAAAVSPFGIERGR